MGAVTAFLTVPGADFVQPRILVKYTRQRVLFIEIAEQCIR